MRITRVRAKNFRPISEVDLELKPLTVVIGPNGAGKSSFLEVIRLLTSMQHGSSFFTKSFGKYGGYSKTVSYQATEFSMKLGVTADRDGEQVKYDVEFLAEGTGYYVNHEQFVTPRLGVKRSDSYAKYEWSNRMREKREGGKLPIEHGPTLLTESRLDSSVREEFRELLALGQSTFEFHAYRFQPNERIRAPQQLQQTTWPSIDGSNLFSAIYTLKTERRSVYAEFMEALQSAVPELEELEFPLAGAGHVSMAWKQSNFVQPFFSNQLSDGILRFLWLVTILHTVPDDGLVMFDEPELSLHPQWLMLLVSLFRKTSARTNVLVATQSAELVRWLQPEEVVIADMTESGTTFRRVTDHKNLDKWLKEFSLGELWTTGELGGHR